MRHALFVFVIVAAGTARVRAQSPGAPIVVRSTPLLPSAAPESSVSASRVAGEATRRPHDAPTIQASTFAETETGSHRVRKTGVVGATVGLAIGVAASGLIRGGESEQAASAFSPRTRLVTYLGSSGAVAGWVVGTTVMLPFRGTNRVGPHDVRNAGITGAAVGFATGVAAASLMSFKCNTCGDATAYSARMAYLGVGGAAVGWLVGRGVGLLLPH